AAQQHRRRKLDRQVGFHPVGPQHVGNGLGARQGLVFGRDDQRAVLAPEDGLARVAALHRPIGVIPVIKQAVLVGRIERVAGHGLAGLLAPQQLKHAVEQARFGGGPHAGRPQAKAVVLDGRVFFEGQRDGGARRALPALLAAPRKRKIRNGYFMAVEWVGLLGRRARALRRLLHWRYALSCLHDGLNGAIPVVVQLVDADGAPVAAAGGQGAVVVEEIALALVVSDAGVGGEAIGHIALDDALVGPRPGGAGGSAVLYHFGLG
nr:hypothetical protein [Tanacetum cinerariifolium]